jgi:N-methylhydantoinase A
MVVRTNAPRISIDVGGTFTDAVVTTADGRLEVGKALTTRARAIDGIVASLAVVAAKLGQDVDALLAEAESLLYGTTRATNSVVEGTTARTAFLTTEGFPDVLALREGGKREPFNYTMAYPEPYVPRNLTFEIAERIGSEGQVIRPLEDASVARAAEAARRAGAEAIGVCLLWSIINPDHERRVGELLAAALPSVPLTLSHQLNPIIREYRRASSTVIDASLKPLMQEHLATLERDLREHRFAGTLLVATAFGGAWPISEAIAKPIYTVGSGPSLAPTAAREHIYLESPEEHVEDLIVCDTGGTTFDVALVSDGTVNRSSEVWLGAPFVGHMLGISAVDINSVGAGGGSIAWVDGGGMLHVGPRSAGASPGPAGYGRGGTEATVTDAALALGYLDPQRFLGGHMTLDVERARAAIREHVAEPLGLDVNEAAAGILLVANEAMVSAIKEITIDQGVDARTATIVAGGGAAGLNILPIAEELGCRRVMIPRTAGALSAYGGSVSSVIEERRAIAFASSDDLDCDVANRVLETLERQLEAVRDGLHFDLADARIEMFVEARYPQQVWELTVPLEGARLNGTDAVSALVERFHQTHERLFAVHEPGSVIECIAWVARLTASPPRRGTPAGFDGDGGRAVKPRIAPAYFAQLGEVPTPRYAAGDLRAGDLVSAPAVIEEPTTTIVVYPGSAVTVTPFGYVFGADVRDPTSLEKATA